MAYRIVWTKNASEDLNEIINYLKENWSLKVSYDFIVELYFKLDLISNYPFAGTESLKDTTITKILITKHNVLYYKIEKDKIRLLDFFDTRQNPNKDKYR